jgi:hypothetical protein
MLNSVSEMVNRAKRILSILQSKAAKLKSQKEAYEHELKRTPENNRQLEKRNEEIMRKKTGSSSLLIIIK